MDKFDRERAESQVEERREKLEAEIDRLRAGLIAGAEQVKKLAFEMPPPNDYTPRFVMLAQSMERYANGQSTNSEGK
jgi:hypothetical protein